MVLFEADIFSNNKKLFQICVICIEAYFILATYLKLLLSKLVSLRGRSPSTLLRINSADEAICAVGIASSQKALFAMTLFKNHISNRLFRRDMQVNLDTHDLK